MNVIRGFVVIIVLIGLVFGIGSIPFIDSAIRPTFGAFTNIIKIVMFIGMFFLAIVIMAIPYSLGGEEK